MNVRDLTVWELSVFIADKINHINGRKKMIRNGEVISGIRPEDILKKRPSREMLEFFVERMYKNV